MDRPSQQARLIAGALAVGFCLATGCAHTGQVTGQPAATTAPSNEEQRIEALTSLRDRLQSGVDPGIGRGDAVLPGARWNLTRTTSPSPSGWRKST